MKVILTFIAAFFICVGGLVAGYVLGSSSRQNTGVATLATTAAPDMDIYQLWRLTNAERQKAGMADLALSSQLNSSASAKCTDMTQFDYWAHNNPNGKTPWDFIKATVPVYKIAGENLEFGVSNADQVVPLWMASPEHKGNVLNAAYTSVGFATCPGTALHPRIVVQHFIGQ